MTKAELIDELAKIEYDWSEHAEVMPYESLSEGTRDWLRRRGTRPLYPMATFVAEWLEGLGLRQVSPDVAKDLADLWCQEMSLSFRPLCVPQGAVEASP